jgi:hypothetical protein
MDQTDVLKMKILRAVEKSSNNAVYVSPEDFRKLVHNKDVNINGILVEKGMISVKVDRLCVQGQVRSGEVVM